MYELLYRWINWRMEQILGPDGWQRYINGETVPGAAMASRHVLAEVDFGSLGNADGWSVEAGARGALTNRLEGYALAGYEDGDQVDGDFYGRLGATVKFNQNWGVSGDVKFSDGDTAWFVGPRFTW